MFSKDPRINPNTANVVGGGDVHQPYARRTINVFLGFAVALILIGVFVGWYFFSPEKTSPNERESQTIASAAQMPGNEYQQGSGRSGVYNFFYKIFGGIEDGLEDNPHNQNLQERYEEMSIDTAAVGSGDYPSLALKEIAERRAAQLALLNQDEYRHSVRDVVGSDVLGRKGQYAGKIHDIIVHKETGKARAIVVNEDGSSRYERDLTALRFKRVMKQQTDGDVMMTITEEKIEDKPDFAYSSLEDTNFVSLRHLHDGQLLDFEGNVTGQIDAVIYENAKAQNIYFTLRPILAREGVSKFHLPFDEINIIESADGYDIKLTREQTVALAEMLFEE